MRAVKTASETVNTNAGGNHIGRMPEIASPIVSAHQSPSTGTECMGDHSMWSI